MEEDLARLQADIALISRDLAQLLQNQQRLQCEIRELKSDLANMRSVNSRERGELEASISRDMDKSRREVSADMRGVKDQLEFGFSRQAFNQSINESNFSRLFFLACFSYVLFIIVMIGSFK